ncbi:uncharacterized protein LOC133814732 [Humulus lupulus]|uniref:uncharacterized protein LOC133814732 n=1 Tax=Humulus lupulus TaxID=3486 RepID=UPI002B416528|nr:uncharacterized protein LOC133814732 [Humulus lupulus]
MAKKKKSARKPVTRSVTQGLPSIQDATAQERFVVDEMLVDGIDQTSGLPQNAEEKGLTEGETNQIDEHTTARMALPSSWADSNLEYAEPLIKDGTNISLVDIDEVKCQSANWSSAVICMVLGANPPMAVFEGFIKRVWGHLGISQIARMTMGLTMVKFNDDATRDHVLETGILHFDRKPIIIRPWSTDLSAIQMIRSVPLWIRLQDLGLQYWGSKCLSALVSTIGKPIMVDKFTRERTRVQFARIMVEMEITDNPPRTIQFLNEHGQLIEQGVDYEWLPVNCKTCAGFGHSMVDCRKEMKIQGIKKDIPSRIPHVVGRDKDEEAGSDIPSRNPSMEGRMDEKVAAGMPRNVSAVPPAPNGQNVSDKGWKSPKKVVYKHGTIESNKKRTNKVAVKSCQNQSNYFVVLQEEIEREKGGFGEASSSHG